MKLSSSQLSFVNIVLLVLAVLFFWDSLVWIQERISVGIFKPFNVLVLLGLGVLLYKRLKERDGRLFYPQSFALLSLVVMCFGVLAYSILDSLYGIRTFNTLAFLLFLFGYLGLFVKQSDWLQSAVPLLLLSLILPFGDLLDTYLGFPLRIQTSNVVEHIISNLGVDLVDHQTILSLENRYTQVDTTCSGLNVLWAGILLYIAFSIIEKVKLGAKWLTLFFSYLVLLLVFNGIRVFVLVVLELVFDLPKIADAVHVPLGLFGFVVPSLLIWYFAKKYQEESTRKEPLNLYGKRPFSFLGQVGVMVLILILYAFAPQKEGAFTKSLHISETLGFESLPLTKKEQAYFDFEGSDAKKFVLDYKSLKGSVVLIATNSFKGHHDPTLCLQSIGFTIKKNEPRIIDGKPFRYLTFGKSSQVGVYWFKNKKEFTDDYSFRVWHDLKNKNKNNNWIQITALLDDSYEPDDLESFFNYINKNVTCNETN